MALQVALVGGGEASSEELAIAERIGTALGRAGAVVVCGGLGGAMEAGCRGAKSAGGLTVGLLPGEDPAAANPWVDVAVPTGLGEARNVLVVRSASAIIAVGGEYGTLSEISLALKLGKPVVGVGTWRLTRPDGEVDGGVVPVEDPEEAVRVALALASSAPR